MKNILVGLFILSAALGALLLSVMGVLIWNPALLLEDFRGAAAVVCGITGFGLLLMAVIGIVWAITSRKKREGKAHE